MVTISGRVIAAENKGIENISVVLQNRANDLGLVVFTNENGEYAFVNVPDGEYWIAKLVDTPEGVPTPGDFDDAVPCGKSTFVCLTADAPLPDMRFVAVTGEDIENLDFPENTTVTEADVSVVKEADPETVIPGNLLTYRITVHNAGPAAAHNVILEDVIPSDLIDVKFSTNGGASFAPWPGSINLGNLIFGESRLILIRGTVKPTTTMPIINTAKVHSDTPDPKPGNNTSTVIVKILTPRCRALIDIIQSVALQEAAAASILDAEGAKLQAFVKMHGLSTCELMEANEQVRRLVGSITRLEAVLQDKLTTVSFQLKDCGKEKPEHE